MAGIDKIYIPVDKYKEYSAWVNDKYVNRCFSDDGVYDYDSLKYHFYNHSKKYLAECIKTKETIPVHNLSHNGNYWLALNCPFDYVQDRLMVMYDCKTHGKLLNVLKSIVLNNIKKQANQEITKIKGWVKI
jgi:hypothetical protein